MFLSQRINGQADIQPLLAILWLIYLVVLKKRTLESFNQSFISLLLPSYGDTANSEKNLSNALIIGKERLKKRLKSGLALYSLGKIYLLMGEKEKAKPLIAKAYELGPTSKNTEKRTIVQFVKYAINSLFILLFSTTRLATHYHRALVVEKSLYL